MFNDLESAVQFLTANGGWGVSVVLGIVVWRLAIYIRLLHSERVVESKTVVEALITTKDAMDKMREVLKAYMSGNRQNSDS